MFDLPELLEDAPELITNRGQQTLEGCRTRARANTLTFAVILPFSGVVCEEFDFIDERLERRTKQGRGQVLEEIDDPVELADDELDEEYSTSVSEDGCEDAWDVLCYPEKGLALLTQSPRRAERRRVRRRCW